jgi:hypothetical protein
LRRKDAFKTGEDIISTKEFSDDKGKVLSSFRDVPDVLPIKALDPSATNSYENLN